MATDETLLASLAFHSPAPIQHWTGRMTTTRNDRRIGQSRAVCCDCGWRWQPRPSTTDEGSRGSSNAVMAAKHHGTQHGHLTVIQRDTYYDYTKKKAR